jgi:hypothetical protein
MLLSRLSGSCGPPYPGWRQQMVGMLTGKYGYKALILWLCGKDVPEVKVSSN